MSRLIRTFAFAASLTALPACASTPAQRGLMVFQQVCAACHGMDHVDYGDMAAFGLSPDTALNSIRCRPSNGAAPLFP